MQVMGMARVVQVRTPTMRFCVSRLEQVDLLKLYHGHLSQCNQPGLPISLIPIGLLNEWGTDLYDGGRTGSHPSLSSLGGGTLSG